MNLRLHEELKSCIATTDLYPQQVSELQGHYIRSPHIRCVGVIDGR